jgi:hypothetical protein
MESFATLVSLSPSFVTRYHARLLCQHWSRRRKKGSNITGDRPSASLSLQHDAITYCSSLRRKADEQFVFEIGKKNGGCTWRGITSNSHSSLASQVQDTKVLFFMQISQNHTTLARWTHGWRLHGNGFLTVALDPFLRRWVTAFRRRPCVVALEPVATVPSDPHDIALRLLLHYGKTAVRSHWPGPRTSTVPSLLGSPPLSRGVLGRSWTPGGGRSPLSDARRAGGGRSIAAWLVGTVFWTRARRGRADARWPASMAGFESALRGGRRG